MRSDKSFKEFLKSGKIKRVMPILVLGIILLMLGIRMSSQDKESESTVKAVRSESEELSEICSAVSGVGRCRVMITYGEGGEVYAIAVLCDGAESSAVRERLTELFSSLYGIRSSRIAILPYANTTVK